MIIRGDGVIYVTIGRHKSVDRKNQSLIGKIWKVCHSDGVIDPVILAPFSYFSDKTLAAYVDVNYFLQLV